MDRTPEILRHTTARTEMRPQEVSRPQEVLRPAKFGKLSVLMPVYNERWTLREIVARVLSAPVPLEIELVAVDDCSSDGSWEILEELAAGDPRIKPVRHPVNKGKGAAIRTAIARMSGEVAIVQDADLEYDPNDYPLLLEPLLQGKADAVFGSRYAGPMRRVGGYWHSLVNRLLTWLSNMLNDLWLSDMETCYKMVRADILRQLRLRSDSFTFEPELTCRLAQWGARIYEVPVSYAGRGYWEGKKIGPIDGLKALWTMVYCRLLDRRFTDHLGYYRQCRQAGSRSHRRLAQQLQQYLGRRILHLGAGIGNLSRLLVRCEQLRLVETDPVYTAALARRFAGCPQVIVEQFDLSEPEALRRLAGSQFETIIWQSPHWQSQPQRWLCELWHLLAPGGYCVLIMPRGEQVPRIETAMRQTGYGSTLCHKVGKFLTAGRLPPGGSVQSDSGQASSGRASAAISAVRAMLGAAVDRVVPFSGGPVVAVGRKPQQASQRAAA